MVSKITDMKIVFSNSKIVICPKEDKKKLTDLRSRSSDQHINLQRNFLYKFMDQHDLFSFYYFFNITQSINAVVSSIKRPCTSNMKEILCSEFGLLAGILPRDISILHMSLTSISSRGQGSYLVPFSYGADSKNSQHSNNQS